MKKKWFAYFGFLILPILLINLYWRNLQLEKDPRFTITTTIRQLSTLKNGLQIEHFYYVNDKMYKDTYKKDERLNIIYPNGKYLVRFSLSHPDVCEVLWNKPVPDNLLEAPLVGWNEIPF